jgi:glycosyltransferase involved in cell wall biosynthesis
MRKHVISNWHRPCATTKARCIREKRAAMVTFSPFPYDPRPRRAAEALMQEGMRVDVICLADDTGAPNRQVLNGIDVLRIPIRHRREGKLRYAYEYASFLLVSALTLALRSLTRRYNMVYVHNMPDALVFSALVPKVLGAKVILDMHDPMPELMRTNFTVHEDSLIIRGLKRLEKWSLGYADAVITVNLACKKMFSLRSCHAEKVSVVMNSPDERIFPLRTARADFPGPSTADRPFVIMYHGTIVPRNGLDLAIAALAEVRRTVPAAELRIYGAMTPFLEWLLHAARDSGIHTAIRYLGPRRLEDLAVEIEHCDVGIIPNQRNVFTELNMPTRIFEYLALGKPVIAPRAPGIQDYFSEESLLYFELGNPRDLARKIEYVYTHPIEVTEIMKRGQRVYVAHAWHQQRQTLVNLVGELLTSAQ